MSKTAETIGRNGRYEISALQVVTAPSHDLVFLDPVSRKRNALLNAGMVMRTEDMDRLAKKWLEQRPDQTEKSDHTKEATKKQITEEGYALIAKAIREVNISSRARREVEEFFAWNFFREDPDFNVVKFSAMVAGTKAEDLIP
jgi:hypothetical protein